MRKIIMPTRGVEHQGIHFANCNCDYGCPCQLNALPTDATCQAIVAWQIHEGYFGERPLVYHPVRRLTQ
jgi:hypothetical protein